jgi:hypothetical protein
MSDTNGSVATKPPGTRAQALEIIKAMSPDGVNTTEIAQFLGQDFQLVSASVSAAFADKPGDWAYVHREPLPRPAGYVGPKRHRYFYDPTRVCTETTASGARRNKKQQWPKDEHGRSTNPDAIRKRERLAARDRERQERQAAEAQQRLDTRAALKAAQAGELYAKVLHEEDGELVLLLADGDLVKGRRLS